MKILVVDHFKDYMKNHIDWFHQFLQEGNVIISRCNTIHTDPVAKWDGYGVFQEGKKDTPIGYDDDYLWYRLLQGIDPSHFIHFNEEHGYPTHLEISLVKDETIVTEKPFPGIVYDPTSNVPKLQELFDFLTKTYPNVTKSNLYFVSEDEEYFKEVKQAKGHCIRIFKKEDFQKVIDTNFFEEMQKENDSIHSTLRPIVDLDGVGSTNVLFAPVEGIIEGCRMFDTPANKEAIKKRLNDYVMAGNILVLFTSLQDLPAKQFESLYTLLDEILMTRSYPCVFLFQRGVTGWQLKTRNRFLEDKSFAENQAVKKMVGEENCYLPFGWHEEKSEMIIPFLEMLKKRGIYTKNIFAVGENVMEDASLIEQVRQLGGTASLIIPGNDPGEALVQSMKRYHNLDKAHVDQFPNYLEHSVKSFEIFMDEYVFGKGKEPQK